MEIDHAFMELAFTTCQANGPVILGEGTGFVRLKKMKDKGFMPLRRDISNQPNVAERGEST